VAFQTLFVAVKKTVGTIRLVDVAIQVSGERQGVLVKTYFLKRMYTRTREKGRRPLKPKCILIFKVKTNVICVTQVC
jgi:hypothetical protein